MSSNVLFVCMACLFLGYFNGADSALGGIGFATENRGNGDTILINEFTNPNNDMDQCKDICTDSYFLLPNHPESQKTCQRGCRFFNIISLRTDHNLNMSNEECYLSCDDAYNDYDLKSACNIGCKTTLKKKQSEMEAVIVYIEQDSKNLFLIEPDLELLESELLSDSNLQSQIKLGDFNIEYKIPETNIRTMPIEAFAEFAEAANNVKPTGDWLDCASRNSGIPKWILLLAIVSAILVALWLSISSEKKVIGDDMLLGDEENQEDLDDDDDVDEEQADKLPEKHAIDADERMDFQIGVGHLGTSDPSDVSDEVAFSAPPKYSLESEKV